jgi:hypothetical protein
VQRILLSTANRTCPTNFRFWHTSGHAISTFVFLIEMIMFVGRFWHITQASVLGCRTLIMSRLIPKSP